MTKSDVVDNDMAATDADPSVADVLCSLPPVHGLPSPPPPPELIVSEPTSEEQLPSDTGSPQLGDWHEPMSMMAAGSGSGSYANGLNGVGKGDKLTCDLSPGPAFSDTSESEGERVLGIGEENMQCPVTHEGREILNLVLPMSVDELFTLLFTNSSFYMDFLQTIRKSTELQMGQWQEGEKTRTIAYTLPLNNNLGVKSTRMSETQTLLDVSRPGDLYAVNAEVTNTGIPYADTFFVVNHYCILRSGHKQSRLVVHAEIKYRKSVWAIVKTFIEKNAWVGMEENFALLKCGLQTMHPSRDAEERSERRAELPHPPAVGQVLGKPTRRPTRRRRAPGSQALKDDNGVELRRMGSHHGSVLGESQASIRASASKLTPGRSDKIPTRSSNAVLYVVFIALVLLLCTNGLLYSKIWALEQLAEQLSQSPQSCSSLASSAGASSPSASNMADLRVLTSNPQSPEEWMGLLRQQETLHRATEFKWRNTLNTVSSFLRQTQDSLTHLEKDIEPDSELIRSILEQIHSKPPSSAPTSGREGSILEPQDQQGSDKPVVESAS